MDTVSATGSMLRGAWGLPSIRTTILAFAVVILVAIGVVPLVYMLSLSVTDATGSFSLEKYRGLFSDSRRRELMLTSTLLGVATAILSTFLGAPLGLLLARTKFPAKQLLRILLVVPLLVPPYVMGLAWILMTGPVGLFAKILGQDPLSSWTYSLTGAIVVLAFSFYPLPMLATEAAARRVDGRLEEAALLVSRPQRVLSQITLPLIAPALAAATLIVFMLAVSEFGVPALLRVRVFTTEVFTAFAAFHDFGAGVALSTPLLLSALTVAMIVNLMTGEHVLTTRRSTRLGLELDLGRFRALALGLVVLIIMLSVVLPTAALTAEAGGVSSIATAARGSGNAIANSLLLAITGATLIVVLALVLGYGRARAQTRLLKFFDAALILMFAVPGTVVGIGLIGVWNRPGIVGQIYSTQWMIVIANIARFAPVAVLMLAANVQQISTSSEEAAEVAGASWARSFMGIVIPLLRRGLVAAWIVSFIFCFGEIGATLLVSPPGESTLPVRVYTLIANTPSSTVASLALLQVAITLLPLVVLSVLVHDKAERTLT